MIKFGLYGLHRGSSVEPETLRRRAALAEEAGFESLWVGDHIALPSELGGDTDRRLEAVVAVAHLAALTKRVRLGFGVLVLPQRQPVLLAKQLSSIDVLSQGRLIVGVGVGYVEPELEAMGVSPADRGARTDEYLSAMRGLWEEGGPAFKGRFISYEGVFQRPRPVQEPHPPIVVGGRSPAAFRRAIQTANGWYGVYLDPDGAAEALTGLRAVADQYERPNALGELEITVTPPGPIDLETAERYAELGVHRLAIQPSTMEGTAIDDLIASVGDRLVGRV
ncbi:TIGR03619 family F420-dependent LLM class oxidoreductase [Nonomuraea sp. NPDC049152]|uniref:TIGR03619 family F420-dependent LLM class oxidoreductase n=1 Tax=Nonomuraea sp. NPDC049152 TaxID=3154350 RepID=UPI0033F6F32A